MRRTLAGSLTLGLGLSMVVARGQDPPAPKPTEPPPTAGAAARQAEPVEKAAATPGQPDIEAIRAEATDRLKALTEGGDPADAARAAELKDRRGLLEERLRLLARWEQAVKERKEAENPPSTPELESAELKAELERLTVGLDGATKAPDGLLPDVFLKNRGPATEPILKEMKDAIDAAQEKAKDEKAALDDKRVDPSRKSDGPLAKLRAGRDQVRQQCATLATRKAEREAALAAAATAPERDLARDRLINLDWETRVESERLRAIEAQIKAASARADQADLRLRVAKVRWELTNRSLELMQARYRAVVDVRREALKRAADVEQARADRSIDPLERFLARRNAALLGLKEQLLKDERAMPADPGQSLGELTDLADKAAEDFDRLKQLVEGGRSTALVAVRLNNNFRRLAGERDAIVRDDLAHATAVLTRYENALTDVELDLLNDSRDDRISLDALLAALPEAGRARAVALSEELEARHRALLDDRRRSLEKLAAEAEACRQQVLRRLRILDDQHAFIRTRIFWLRDAPPVGAPTFSQAQAEVRRAAQAVLHAAGDPLDRSLWVPINAEFLAAALALLALPWPLYRARRLLRHRLRPSAPRPAPVPADGDL